MNRRFHTNRRRTRVASERFVRCQRRVAIVLVGESTVNAQTRKQPKQSHNKANSTITQTKKKNGREIKQAPTRLRQSRAPPRRLRRADSRVSGRARGRSAALTVVCVVARRSGRRRRDADAAIAVDDQRLQALCADRVARQQRCARRRRRRNAPTSRARHSVGERNTRTTIRAAHC